MSELTVIVYFPFSSGWMAVAIPFETVPIPIVLLEMIVNETCVFASTDRGIWSSVPSSSTSVKSENAVSP